MKKALTKIFDTSDVFEYNFIKTSELEFLQEVRQMCVDCNNYNTSWACPPAIGTIDQCKEQSLKYNTIALYSAKFEIEDSFDFEGMIDAGKDFDLISQDVNKRALSILNDCLFLTRGGCNYCEECTYPDNPCRFPDKVKGSLEGYGLFVSELAKKADIKYINGENTVTYFGAILFNDI